MKLFVAAFGGMMLASAFADVAFTNDLAVIAFDAKGCVSSLRCRADGAELVDGRHPFCVAGCRLPVVGCRLGEGGRLVFGFSDGGEAVFGVRSFGAGWTFTLESCTASCDNVAFGCLAARCTKYRGYLANMLSDDAHGVCLRSYDTKGRMSSSSTELKVDVDRARGFEGTRVGLVAGRREDLVPALRKMTEVAGVPHTVNGGAWSLGAEGNRGSYCFAFLRASSVEDWIDCALRGGFGTIHMNCWWKTRGHYDFEPDGFPRGADDWKAVCDAIHAAGLKVGMHCLTGSVQPRDTWATPRCREELMDWCTVTLARDLGPTDTVMYVEEPVDIEQFHTFHSYSSKGNTFRAGTELIQYSGVLSKPPYGFTGVTRGAWNSEKTGVIPAGTKLHYLYQRYDAFFPLPDSKLAGELAAAIGKARAIGDVDQIYMDGAEAVREDRYYTEDRYREQIVRELKPEMLIEGSNGDAFTWWYLSRYGAWDLPYFGMKRMHDGHLRDVDFARKRNLIEPQLGWWCPVMGNAEHPGHHLDDMEYFAARNSERDVAMSTMGLPVSADRPIPFEISRQLTLQGWYERFRLARAYSDAAKEKLAKPRQETRLRLDPERGWQLWSADIAKHRATGGEGSGKWTVDLATAPASAALRVEALYEADEAATNRVKFLAAADFATLKSPYQVEGVSCRTQTSADGEHGPTLVIDARSERESSRGAELCLKREWTQQPYFNAKGCGAFEVWVKGDGSGADLWFVAETPNLYHLGESHHRAKLDFTGWRRFVFLMRERDIEEAYRYEWRGGLDPMVTCAQVLNMEHICAFRVHLNELPSGRDVHVELSEVTAMPAKKAAVARSAVRVGGKTIEIPFEMASGDYAELEEGRWTHYGEDGQVRGCGDGALPALEAGPVELSYGGKGPDGSRSRAEVTLQTVHSPVAALKEFGALAAEGRRAIGYEAVMPSVYCPSNGLVRIEPVVVRPGERARLELTVYGPVSKPALVIGGERWTFDVELDASSRLYCKDGISWRVARGISREQVAAGRLERKLPVLEGGLTEIGFASADDTKADARIEMVKRYGRW